MKSVEFYTKKGTYTDEDLKIYSEYISNPVEFISKLIDKVRSDLTVQKNKTFCKNNLT